jgi:hypothetical protein
MQKVIVFVAMLLVNSVFGQNKHSADRTPPDNQNEYYAAKRLMDSSLHPLTYAKTFDDFLRASFTANSSKDGRWVYYKDRANLKKLNEPLLEKVAFGSSFYQVDLTNYLGYHVNEATCIVVFDSAKGKMTLAEPLWYGGVNEALVKIFIRHRFEGKDSLVNFLNVLHNLMEIGSGYKFRQTSYSDSLITYDLGYFKGDSYTTGSKGITSTINYTEDGIWRKIIVAVKDFAIVGYTVINPVSGQPDFKAE